MRIANKFYLGKSSNSAIEVEPSICMVKFVVTDFKVRVTLSRLTTSQLPEFKVLLDSAKEYIEGLKSHYSNKSCKFFYDMWEEETVGCLS